MAGSAGVVDAMARLTPEELAAFVAESCRRQGVPVKVTDANVLANIATLLRGDVAGFRRGERSELERSENRSSGERFQSRT